VHAATLRRECIPLFGTMPTKFAGRVGARVNNDGRGPAPESPEQKQLDLRKLKYGFVGPTAMLK